MTPDAALDRFAYSVALHLMGSDERRRFRIALLGDPSLTPPTSGVLERLQRLEALLSGESQPETLQDHLDVANAERERTAAPFDPTYWLRATDELMRAGFTPQQAAALVQNVRLQVDPPAARTDHLEEQTA